MNRTEQLHQIMKDAVRNVRERDPSQRGPFVITDEELDAAIERFGIEPSSPTVMSKIPQEAISLRDLREANAARQKEWCPDQMPDLLFRGNELGGECGEAQNVIKKLERERLGWAGSRATVDDLADELADVVICADLTALTAGIDLNAAVARKFNATSEKVGLCTRLTSDAARAQRAEAKPTDRHYVSRDNGTRMDGKRVTVLSRNDKTVAFKWEDSETPRHLGVEEFHRRFYLFPLAPQPTERGKVLEEIATERARQITDEGWTSEHDDQHDTGQMAEAAAGYALKSTGTYGNPKYPPNEWPWDIGWWKPTTPRRDLVKAAALLVAEIERLDRAALAGGEA